MINISSKTSESVEVVTYLQQSEVVTSRLIDGESRLQTFNCFSDWLRSDTKYMHALYCLCTAIYTMLLPTNIIKLVKNIAVNDA